MNSKYLKLNLKSIFGIINIVNNKLIRLTDMCGEKELSEETCFLV